MIPKKQFLELKHLKSLGVPTTTIAKKFGISVPSANKWLRPAVVVKIFTTTVQAVSKRALAGEQGNLVTGRFLARNCEIGIVL